jgi:hypothetical protein
LEGLRRRRLGGDARRLLGAIELAKHPRGAEFQLVALGVHLLRSAFHVQIEFPELREEEVAFGDEVAEGIVAFGMRSRAAPSQEEDEDAAEQETRGEDGSDQGPIGHDASFGGSPPGHP